jgi:hypothetical protein
MQGYPNAIATAAKSAVEDLERQWSVLIQQSKGSPAQVVPFLEKYLHQAYRKVGLQIYDKTQELLNYPDWLKYVDYLDTPKIGSIYYDPDTVVVYGTDYMVSGGLAYRSIWRDRWLNTGEGWQCVEVREIDVQDVTGYVLVDPSFPKVLLDYIKNKRNSQ